MAWTPGPVLGLETSCDETAAAVFDPTPAQAGGRGRLLSDVTASQVALHAPHGGVVPELASRQHLRDVPRVVERALAEAGLRFADLHGVAVTAGPGLVGPILVGTCFAKSLVLGRRGLPLVGVHHLEGHVRSAFLDHDEPDGPYLALVVSGGHTSLLRVHREGFQRRHEELARTRDDAAGEAFDKVGKLLGLGYPAGPVIDRLVAAWQGEVEAFAPARVKADRGQRVERRAFSFSGLKTAVRHRVAERGIPPVAEGEDPASRPDLLPVLAGFQEAAVGMLVRTTLHVAREERLEDVIAVGGVSANTALRQRLQEACGAAGLRLILPAPRWSTDNGAMIAAAGALRLAAGRSDGLDLAADPALPLP